MIQHSISKLLFTVMICITVIAFIGCEKKTEQQQTDIKTEVDAPDTVSAIAEPEVDEKIEVPDLKGTWTGKFDKRATTFKITEQTDSSFSGKITINYRQVINQEVKGIFSPTTLKMTMTDQLHSRFEGKYDGKLNKDLNNFSGTFTMKLDGSKFSFNLNKK